MLVVDDEPSARELLCSYLEAEGCIVMTAISGAAAIEMALRVLPDLIVTDVLMPGPGGLQTLRELKENSQTAKIPVIVVSGVDPNVSRLYNRRVSILNETDRPIHFRPVSTQAFNSAQFAEMRDRWQRQF